MDDVGSATVAPPLQGLRAQAPSPSLTEGTHAVSRLHDFTKRSLECDCDAGLTANRRCAAARGICRVATPVTRRDLARCRQGRGMGKRTGLNAADCRRLQGRPRNEPERVRAVACE